jgi:alpha-beta hydrolase superfamily lysophospholipase
MKQVALMLAVLVGFAAPAVPAPVADRVDMPLRGRAMALTVYRPAGTPTGTIIMGSGDVGWVGLAVSLAQHLSGQGYVVIGVNVRDYLSAFTTRTGHLTPLDIQHDFSELSRYMRARGLLPPPVILSGVSEGAALAVLAASAPENHAWAGGVITMGLPALAEIAWRWSDFTAWITKKDAAEPSFAPGDYIAAIAPLPLVMIQSKKDEYVPEADYRAFERAAHDPSRLVLIDASNHRFTDRMPQLHRAYADALDWIRSRTPSRAEPPADGPGGTTGEKR